MIIETVFTVWLLAGDFHDGRGPQIGQVQTVEECESWRRHVLQTHPTIALSDCMKVDFTLREVRGAP